MTSVLEVFTVLAVALGIFRQDNCRAPTTATISMSISISIELWGSLYVPCQFGSLIFCGTVPPSVLITACVGLILIKRKD